MKQLSFLLIPFEFLFYLIVIVRNWMFDIRFLKIRHFSIPVISVGNISAGGTGKTPHVFYLAKAYLAAQKKVCIVSRGYGGHYGGYPSRVQESLENAASIYGDEPVYYSRELGVPVYVGHDRSSTVNLAIDEQKPDIILSDDSFQHRWLGRHWDIVLVDATDSKVHLFPRGRYREPLSSLKRANTVLLTKCDQVSQPQIDRWLNRLKGYGYSLTEGNLFLSNSFVESIEILRGMENIAEGERVFLGSSIARPESFFSMMKTKYNIQKHFSFSDHHLWTQQDVDRMESEAIANRVRFLLVTEKDAVKLETLLFKYIQVYVVKMGLKIQPTWKVPFT